MSCVLTKGRTEPLCRDNVGGIKYIYFFKFIEYSDSQIEGTKGVEITAFPDTNLYRYEPNSASFSETIGNDENGVKFEQSLTFGLAKQDVLTTNQLDLMQSIDLRYIVQYNSGKLRMGGVYNSSSITSYSIESGGAKSSLNGYNITIGGTEEYAAPFISSLNIISSNSILLEDSFYLLLEDTGKIILQ